MVKVSQRAFWAGLVSGFLVGVFDSSLQFAQLEQFIPSAFGRILTLIYHGALYGVFTAFLFVIGMLALTGLLRVLPKGTKTKDGSKHSKAAWVWFAFALLLGATATWLTGHLKDTLFPHRNNPDLVKWLLWSVRFMAGAGIFFIFAALSKKWPRSLGKTFVVLFSGGLLLALIAVTIGVVRNWETLSLVPAFWSSVWFIASLGCAAILFRFVMHPPRTVFVYVATVVLLVLVFSLGNSGSRQKASKLLSKLGSPYSRVLQSLGDWDRDGFSTVLAGEDCNDRDASIHPGAKDIPDDNIDQNCLNGDLKSRHTQPPKFAPVPTNLPDDMSVLFVTIDTLRWDHLGTYGYDRNTSPFMDALASEGAVFENAWAHAPSTRYSIPALLTGKHPLRVDYDYSIRGWPGLLPQATTIAEIAKAAGLYTGAILNYWYFDANRRMNQGVDSYDNENKRLHKSVQGAGPAETSGRSSVEQTDKAIAFYEKNPHPSFLWVHYYDPHFQYDPPEEFAVFGNRPVDRYDGEILSTDAQLGRLINYLKKSDRYDRTLVVITGDHGEGFGEHGIDLHGYHLYAAQTRVPLIMRVPGLTPRRIKTPAAHVDVYATVANLLGAPPSAQMEGNSLVPELTGAPDQDRWVFQQLSYEGNHELRAIANGQCHIIYNMSPQTSWEVYHIDIDPEETQDRYESPGKCKEGIQTLARLTDEMELPPYAHAALLKTPPTLSKPTKISFGPVDLVSVDFPTSVKSGEPLEMQFTFLAHGPLSDDWKLFVHFDQRGTMKFQGDHSPKRPFSWWKKGQYIQYKQTVTVPRFVRGSVTIWLGLFKGPERFAPKTDLLVQDNRVKVGMIKVTP